MCAQNISILREYRAKRDNISMRRGADHLQEQYLFHGTNATPPMEIAQSADGFMADYSRADCLYGKGTTLTVSMQCPVNYWALRLQDATLPSLHDTATSMPTGQRIQMVTSPAQLESIDTCWWFKCCAVSRKQRLRFGVMSSARREGSH